MSDMIQVVRPFDGVEVSLNDEGKAVRVMSVFNVSAQEWMPIGEVIELREDTQRFHESHPGFVRSPNGEVRWVSDWRSNR